MANDDKKVTRIPRLGDRRQSLVAQGVKSAITKDQPQIGGTQGDYTRPPCGTCLSWRRDKRAGTQGVPLTAGQCMFGPPHPHPIMTDNGVMVGCIAVRSPMQSDSEGCDQHDDGTDPEEDDDDGDEPGGGSTILAAG